MSTALTVSQLQDAMPKQLKAKIDEDLVNKVNQLAMDEEFRQVYRDNLLSYTSVMQDGKFTVEKYINAVRYVSYKLMGDTNIKAYMRTFPDKYADFKKRGVADKDIASYSTAYNKSKLVNLIFEQTLIPSHILNADLYQKALNQQAYLMLNAKSEMVQTNAANSLLTHLKPPETKKLEIEVTHQDSSVIEDLRNATMEYARIQQQAVAAKAINAKDAAHSKLVMEGEYVNVN